MSLRFPSDNDLAISALTKIPVSESGSAHRTISVSSTNLNAGILPYGPRSTLDMKGGDLLNSSMGSQSNRVQIRGLRAVVRPASAFSPGGMVTRFGQIQGELVRKRKECEELKQRNKWLANELHLEKIVLRSENVQTMRTLRSLNLEMQSTIKELKQKSFAAQEKLVTANRLVEEAGTARGEAVLAQTQAESQTKQIKEERDNLRALNIKLQEEIRQLKDKLNEIQHQLTQVQKNYFESKLKLDRIITEKQLILDENRDLELERNEQKVIAKELKEKVSKLSEKEAASRHRAAAAEEAWERCARLQCEAERDRRLAEHHSEVRERECDLWRHKHDSLSDILRGQEEEKAKRQSKACQAKFQTYFLCMSEIDQRVSIAKKHDGTPNSFVGGERVEVSFPVDETDEHGHDSSRAVYQIAAPDSTAQVYFSEVASVGHTEKLASKKGRKLIDYFWLPASDDELVF